MWYQITLPWKMIWLGQLRYFSLLNLECLFIRDLLLYFIPPPTLHASHGSNKSHHKPVSKQEAQFYANNTQFYVFSKEKCITFTESVPSSIPVVILTLICKYLSAQVLWS